MTERKKPTTTSLTIMGIVSIILGVVAITAPLVAGKAVVIVIGVSLLMTGIVQIITGLRAEGWSHRLPPLVLGAITAVAGFGVVGHPLFGLSFLTLLIAIFFVVEGIWKIIGSFSYRPASGWLAVLVSGILTLMLGAMIWSQWPVSGMWAVGVLVGVDLVMTGISLLMLATTINRVKDLVESATPPREDAATS